MLQRAMQILTEASQVWPLAARWLENLEKFYRDNKGAIPGIEGSMDDSVRVTQLLENVAAPCLTVTCESDLLTPTQRDPVPEALQAAPARPPSRNGTGTNQTATQDGGSQQGRNGETPNNAVMQAPPQVPTPMMYIDPSMRMSQQTQAAQAMAGMPQQQLGDRPATDGLGLLLEAFDSHQGANMAAAGAGQAYDPSLAANQAGYYGQPGTAMPGNDGYENELQFYIDGAPTVHGWVGTGAGMYGY